MKNKLILYSGGMDSTVALYQYASEIKLAVSFDYGSKHNAIEISKAALNCKNLNIPHKVIRMDLNEMGFVSDLLSSGGSIPEGHYQDESMRKTVVPFRNGIMLSIAAGLAESIECDQVLISNHAGDHRIYPDCTPEFVDNMNKAMNAGTYNNVKIFAPFTFLTKREIALIGQKLEINFANTYSCYNGKEEHCGVCGTCTERKEALEGFDTTIYVTR